MNIQIIICLKKEEDNMNYDNRRLKEIQQEKHFFTALLEKAKNESEKQTYTGKLELLEKEEKEILERYDVII